MRGLVEDTFSPKGSEGEKNEEIKIKTARGCFSPVSLPLNSIALGFH